MDLFWEAPDNDYKKINVHCVVAETPLPNGNQVSVGLIIRDSKGVKLWGALRPFPQLTKEQAIMSGIQPTLIEAQKLKWELKHIETTSRHVYDTIRHQEHVYLDDEQLEVYSMFNTIYANHYKEGSTQRVISCIPQRMNSIVEYMAVYDLANATEFGVVTHLVGDLKYNLDKDMGLTLPNPVVEVFPNLGDGEVINGPPPIKNCKTEDSKSEREDVTDPMFKDKGKNKVLINFSFNDNGVLKQKVVRALENGSLKSYSQEFGKQVVDLNVVVGKGIFARDVLHHAMLGSLSDIVPLLYENLLHNTEDVEKLISVDQVLALMGFSSGLASCSSSSCGV